MRDAHKVGKYWHTGNLENSVDMDPRVFRSQTALLSATSTCK